MSTLRTIVLCVFLGLLLQAKGWAGGCGDSLLLDLSENIVRMGYDTTGHWWVITQPYTSVQNLVVDGKTYGPFNSVDTIAFSADGTTWAALAVRNQIRIAQTPDKQLFEPEGLIVGVHFSPLGNALWRTVVNGTAVRITNGERVLPAITQPLSIKMDPSGMMLFWTEARGSQQVLVQNGNVLQTADECILAGVWVTGEPVYAIRIGSLWQVYKGEQQLLSNVRNIADFQVNPLGTVCAWKGSVGAAPPQVFMYSDEMQQPWASVPAESIGTVALSPTDALVAFWCMRNGRNLVNYNNAEYSAGTQTSPPTFTSGGEVMIYSSLDPDAAVVVNGKRNYIRGGVNTSEPTWSTPSGRTAGWASKTTMVIADIELNLLAMGRMVDVMGPMIYHRASGSFKGLGLYGNRLFHLYCVPND